MLKKTLLKVLFLTLMLAVFNFIYAKWFYENDIQKHAQIINLVRDVPNNADIIYIGESSNSAFRGDDVDKRNISQFIGDHFPSLNTYDITKPGSHAGIYKVLLEKIPKENNVKTVVVTLNLRSFNAQWVNSDLETPLQKSLVLLKDYPPLFNRFLLSFKDYDSRSEGKRNDDIHKKWVKDEFDMPNNFQFKNVVEWDYWMANSSKFEKSKRDLASHYIKAYGFQIDTNNNPRVKDFNDIIALAKDRKWNLVFNLLAENTQKAEDLVGEDLIFMMNQNVEKLTNYFEEKGVLVVNNLNRVDDEQFIDQDWTTEHYAEKGRRTVARHVAKALTKYHAGFVKTVNYQTHFLNTCDDGLNWGQMYTLTKEKAYSGKKSSMTGNGNDFSLTLEYPFKIIPDSLKNTLKIDFWFYQTSTNHDAQLIFVANKKSIEYYRNKTSIKEHTAATNKWVKFEKIITIPDNVKQADLIKVYIYNPSNTKVYIDDFRVIVKD